MEIKPNEQMKAKTGTDRWKHKHIKEVKLNDIRNIKSNIYEEFLIHKTVL